MSVATILDPSTGKIAESFLPDTSQFTNLTTDTLTFTLYPGPPPSTASGSDGIQSVPLAFTNDSFVGITNGGVATAASLLSGPVFAHVYSDPYGGITDKMELDGTSLTYHQSGSGATFPILTANPATGKSALTNVSTINGTAFPPLQVGGAPSTSAQIPDADFFTFTLPVPSGTQVGAKLVATITLTFKLAPALPFPVGTGNDATPTLTFSQQSGTHTAPLPAPVPFASAPVSLLYPAKFDGTDVPNFTYSVTATDTFVSDGNTTWTFSVSAASPTHTYVVSNTSSVATLVQSS